MEEARVFRTRRTIGRAGVFLAVFGLFIPAGVLAATLGGRRTAGILLIGFGVLTVLPLLQIVLAPRSCYRLDSRQLLLAKGFASRRIALADINGARMVSEAEADALVTGHMAPAVAAEESLDLKGWHKANRRYGRFVKFCTVPIVQSKKTSGHTLNITGFAGKTSGQFILLRDQSGTELLLSPAEPEAFLRALPARIRTAGGRPGFTPGEAAPPAPGS